MNTLRLKPQASSLSSLQQEQGRHLQARPTQAMACNHFASDRGFETTDLQVSYEISTLEPVEDLTAASANFARKLPVLVQGAAVEAVHYRICELGLDESTAGKPNTVARLAQCVYSISQAEEGDLTYCHNDEDATAVDNARTTTNNSNCVALQGDIKIFHKKDCADEIKYAALLALEQGVDEARFLDSVNDRLKTSGNAVTSVMIIENQETHVDGAISGVVSTTTTTTESNEELIYTEKRVSPGGYVVIALAGVLLLLLFALLFVQQRQRRRKISRTLEDLKSIRTDTSMDGNGSYRTADFNNLAQEHSKMNVHRCTSALCPVCLSNPDDVHMVTVSKDHRGVVPSASAYEEYEAREDGVEAVADTNSPPGTPERKRRRFLQAFRKQKKPSMRLESVSFVRVASARPSEKDDTSVNTCEL